MASRPELSQIVSTKGQVVIPAELRQQLGIQPGTQVRFEKCEEGILLRPVTPEFIRGLRGYFGKGPSLEDIREQEHRKKDRS
jgi:AbrB family looped-hinge helix DNA binding protein